MERRSYLKIPLDRVGALIGPDGSAKRRIEKALGVILDIEGESGSVEIALSPEAKDISVLLTAQNIVRAVGRGFNPMRAERLAEEDFDLLIIDLTEYLGTSKNTLARIRGRIIGKDGKSRELLEEMTETMISVYGDTIAIIGRVERLEVAREAILMLVRGAFHKSVWNYLYAQRRKMKKEMTGLWEESLERARR